MFPIKHFCTSLFILFCALHKAVKLIKRYEEVSLHCLIHRHFFFSPVFGYNTTCTETVSQSYTLTQVLCVEVLLSLVQELFNKPA